MVVPKKGRRLGGSSSHQKAIMKNLAISLFESGRIETTIAKAKRLKGFVDKLIGIAKKESLSSRRQCFRLLGNYGAVQKLFNDIAPNMYDRSSGFTRVIRYKNRLGDGAEIAVVELINYKPQKK
ncbi:MAG: 50S ribosomal protein L17 [Actinobacteria bacterium]|nr:50S ribosomal protein L17 [Actinomycetota bacterium]